MLKHQTKLAPKHERYSQIKREMERLDADHTAALNEARRIESEADELAGELEYLFVRDDRLEDVTLADQTGAATLPISKQA